MYFPQRDVFVSTGVCERYAFDSCFTVDLSGQAPTAAPVDDGGTEGTVSTQTLEAVRSYDYTGEAVSLAARVVLTIGIELGIALLFGYRTRRPLLFIAAVNAVTQLLLNGTLTLLWYWRGQQSWLIFGAGYLALEALVFAVEAALYVCFLKRLAPADGRHPVWYALTANVVSFAAGMALAQWLPQLF